MVAGANKEGYHYKGLNLERDPGEVNYVDIAKLKRVEYVHAVRKIQIGISVVSRLEIYSSSGIKYTKL